MKDCMVFKVRFLRAIVSKIETTNVAVKFCFSKTHVSLDSRVITKPNLPIQMGSHTPRGHIQWPAHFSVQNCKKTFLLLEPLDEELSRKWLVPKMFLGSCPFEICAAIPDSISGSLSVGENAFCKQTAAMQEADLWPKFFLHIFDPCTLSYL